MDIHHKLSAWLHIAAGLIALLLIGLTTAFFGAAMVFVEAPPELRALVAAFGTIIVVVLGAAALVGLVAGVACLDGWSVGRPLILVASALQLLNVPLGTALGIYTFWAYLRDFPSGMPGTQGRSLGNA